MLVFPYSHNVLSHKINGQMGLGEGQACWWKVELGQSPKISLFSASICFPSWHFQSAPLPKGLLGGVMFLLRWVIWEVVLKQPSRAGLSPPSWCHPGRKSLRLPILGKWWPWWQGDWLRIWWQWQVQMSSRLGIMLNFHPASPQMPFSLFFFFFLPNPPLTCCHFFLHLQKINSPWQSRICFLRAEPRGTWSREEQL